jgi:hypothetical protein
VHVVSECEKDSWPGLYSTIADKKHAAGRFANSVRLS